MTSAAFATGIADVCNIIKTTNTTNRLLHVLPNFIKAKTKPRTIDFLLLVCSWFLAVETDWMSREWTNKPAEKPQPQLFGRFEATPSMQRAGTLVVSPHIFSSIFETLPRTVEIRRLSDSRKFDVTYGVVSIF